MTTPADTLADLITASTDWPPRHAADAWRQVTEWQAFREANSDLLNQITPFTRDNDCGYIADPLPAKISQAFADLLYGEDPDIDPGSEHDADSLAAIVDDNDLPSELQAAADIQSSEGEVWWRLLIDPEQADRPLIRFLSRTQVIPLIRGRRPVAVAFVFVIEHADNEDRVTRLIEIHGPGEVRNHLFTGTASTLGHPVPLEQHPATADLTETWEHGLPMLAGRIVNRLGRSAQLGVSDYAGVRDLLLALNETVSIGQHNARLTLRKRVIVPSRFLDQNGNFPAGADVIVAHDTDTDPDKPGQGLAQVEWNFDADAFISYKRELETTIIARVGLTPQLVGMATADGGSQALTGPAIKLRYLPATLTAEGKARSWDDQLPVILSLAQRLDALPQNMGGFGRQWTDPETPPSVKRAPVLPEDDGEEAKRHVTLVTGEIESRRTAIETLHPDWSTARVDEEIARIHDDQRLAPGADIFPQPSAA